MSAVAREKQASEKATGLKADWSISARDNGEQPVVKELLVIMMPR